MKRFLILIATLALACLTSCVRDVSLDAGESPQVIVDCILSNDDVQELYLCFTKGASRQEAEPLTEAVATLIDLTESKTVGEFVKSEKDNLWTLDYSAIPQHHYRLEVYVSGHDLIYAEDTMPKKTGISQQTITHSEPWYHEMHPEEYVGIPDEYPHSFAGTYYRFDDDFNCPLWIFGIDHDRTTNLAYIMTNTPIRIYEEPVAASIFTDLPNVDHFNVTENVYVPSLSPYYNSGDTKVEGVTALYPNLKGSLKHQNFLRVEGGRSNKPFLVNCDFQKWVDTENNPIWGYRYIVFMHVSDIYDAYLKESYELIKIKNSSVLSSIYFRNNLSSNIHGGLGVFGCKIEQITMCWVSPSYISEEEYQKFNIDDNHRYIF